MLSVGPWPVSTVMFLIALAVAAAVGAAVAHRSPAGTKPKMLPVIIDIALIGLVAARLGFVIEWLPLYLAHPWTILRIDDGGFAVWPGVAGAAVFAVWRERRTPSLRWPLGAAMLAGWLSWALLNGAVFFIQQSAPTLPMAQLARLDRSPVSLATLGGKPMVVNLWATWYPPCRREMPVLAAAQRRRPDVRFVFVNQGEGRARIRRYLRAEHLQLKNVLLDPFASVGRTVGSQALPTTLFFDASGKLVDFHTGAFSKATLAARLSDFGQLTAHNHNPT